MFDLYIMYIFVGANVNHTSSKYAGIHCFLFYQVPSLKSARCPSPLFRQFPTIYCFFFLRPHFQRTYIILEFSTFNPIPSFLSN